VFFKILEEADERLRLRLKERNEKLLSEVEGMRIDFPES
jgi:hypothetical protein